MPPIPHILRRTDRRRFVRLAVIVALAYAVAPPGASHPSIAAVSNAAAPPPPTPPPPSPAPAPPLLKTTARPRFVVQYYPRERKWVILNVLVRDVPAGSYLAARCRPGCRSRFESKRVRSYRAVTSFPSMRGTRARPGTQIAVLVSHPTMIGTIRVVRFRAGGDKHDERSCPVPPGRLHQRC